MIDAEVRLVGEHPLTVWAVFGQVSCPVAADTGQAEAVSARCGDRVDEDFSAQRAQEGLLREEADRGRHSLKMT